MFDIKMDWSISISDTLTVFVVVCKFIDGKNELYWFWKNNNIFYEAMSFYNTPRFQLIHANTKH